MNESLISKSEYNSYYQTYIDKVNSGISVVESLKKNLDVVVSFYSGIPKAKHDFSYAEGKWTVKDVLLHVIDTERIFAYRALRIARFDGTALPGFEHNDYVEAASANHRTFTSLVEEYKSVREATITLFSSFSSEALLQIGEASGFPISVRAIGFIIVGHDHHHAQIIKERYL
ncbi:DinB family protein [Winogradskyella vidalii]|uniref:DinB family protein n=1 Tax=Winogradskyella vidalii TaxID=2615024 RepID=UPI0015C8DF08|nr:DinB family protein [Winogradskyella vidalii]